MSLEDICQSSLEMSVKALHKEQCRPCIVCIEMLSPQNAGEDVPAPGNPCLRQHRIDDRLQTCDIVLVVAINEVVFVGRVNRFVFCRILLRGHLADGLLRDPQRLHPARTFAIRIGAAGHARPHGIAAALVFRS